MRGGTDPNCHTNSVDLGVYENKGDPNRDAHIVGFPYSKEPQEGTPDFGNPPISLIPNPKP